MKLSEARGKLVAIGGGEDKKNEREILKEFVRLARGAKARLVVMTVATDEAEEAGAEYREVFNRLGVDDVTVVDVSTREDAESEASMRALREATGIFFTGGDQLHITTLLGGTDMHKLLKERYEKGIVLGGTSAGAAMMSNSMFIRGDSEETPRFGGMELGPGMDFIVGAVIDTHFSQRGRIGRLVTAVAHYPQDLGLGIDENTAMIVQGDEFEVIGEGAVTVVDAGDITYTNLPYVSDGDALGLYNIKLHILPAGHRFSLAERCPLVREPPTTKKGKAKDSGKREKRTKGRTKGSRNANR
ncbi:MAG TPA: cyanophycinase [Pyrinomonadaceae bacterium]|jgi:cyanophycinase